MTAPDNTWMVDGLCREVGGDFWYPERGENPMEDTHIAQSICRRCTVQETCLSYALETGEVHGIWGGLTPRQRVKLGRARPRSPFPHGTEAGCRRHYREGSKPCDPCRKADRVAQRERRWTGS